MVPAASLKMLHLHKDLPSLPAARQSSQRSDPSGLRRRVSCCTSNTGRSTSLQDMGKPSSSTPPGERRDYLGLLSDHFVTRKRLERHTYYIYTLDPWTSPWTSLPGKGQRVWGAKEKCLDLVVQLSDEQVYCR